MPEGSSGHWRRRNLAATFSFNTIPLLAPIREELQDVVLKMRSASRIEDQAIDAVMESVISAGGKLIRPALAIIATQIYGAERDYMISLAASVEMLHTATLVHDDMIDDAARRRGYPTVHTLLNPASAVLLGDFLFAQAAEWAAETNNVTVVRIFARTLMTIVEGELHQLWAKRDLMRSEENYYERIYGKTAALFACACETGAILGGAPEAEVAGLREYGRLMGLAFQIVDDILDFAGDPDRLGKPVGGDLRGGTITLPLIFYLREFHPEGEQIEVSLLNGGKLPDAEVDELVARIVASPALDRSLAEAERLVAEAKAALTVVPDGPHCQMLADIGDYIVKRRH